jgi:3'-phosphoadenosine 5'-phosphosulfate sulfotransferase (PAPS reductase)/FAD synthetase
MRVTELPLGIDASIDAYDDEGRSETDQTTGKNMKPRLTIVSYGGGTNSTAMLIGMKDRNWRPDVITFSDTGGEKPETYTYIETLRKWLRDNQFPDITILRGKDFWTPKMVTDESLEGQCLRLGVLPSKAYGLGTCSLKWKVEPADRFLKQEMLRREIAEKRAVLRLVGFDAGEPSRVLRAQARQKKRHESGDAVTETYPLYEWGWSREECASAIKKEKLPLPGKSACFFCPSSKKHEVLALPKDLLDRALEIERKAFTEEGEGKHRPSGTNVVGLGRHWSWKALTEYGQPTISPFESRYCEPSCDTCFDGD